jgi:hypothetical protein
MASALRLWIKRLCGNGIGSRPYETGHPRIGVAHYADANDGKPWTTQDLEDLKVCIGSGLTVAQTAAALSREGTIEDVLRVAEHHGWHFHKMDAEAHTPGGE